MPRLRFAVLSDTHYCTLADRGRQAGTQGYERLPDCFRYAGMVDKKPA